MTDQDYTQEDIKKAMLNEACPKMEGYYSDLCEDLKLIDTMKVGQTAQWFYRQYGTSFRVEDPEGFERDYNFWKHQVFKVFTIKRIGNNIYSVTEINITQNGN